MPRLNRDDDAPEPVDIHVGSRIRLRRTLLGMSQDKLARSVGISFQQLQKYESGFNRVSASRLYALAQVLGVAIGWFFEDAPKACGKRPKEQERDPMEEPETVRLVRAYYRIDDARVRQRILAMVRAVGPAEARA